MSRNVPRTRAQASATLRLSRRALHTPQRLNQPRHIAGAIFLLTDRGRGAHLLAVPSSRKQFRARGWENALPPGLLIAYAKMGRREDGRRVLDQLIEK